MEQEFRNRNEALENARAASKMAEEKLQQKLELQEKGAEKEIADAKAAKRAAAS